MEWKTIEADGCIWEVRAIVNSPGTNRPSGEDVLEFRTADVNMPPRRLVVSAGALEHMQEEDLRAAFMRARPIGGDHYGRPGKQMTDTAGRLEER